MIIHLEKISKIGLAKMKLFIFYNLYGLFEDESRQYFFTKESRTIEHHLDRGFTQSFSALIIHIY